MQHREAYSRYRLIDNRLRRKPSPSLEDLVQYVSERADKPVSKRSIQRDLEEMRYNQNLQFLAPIVYDRDSRTYRYSDPAFSISRLPVSSEELHGLEFAVGILEQFRHLPAIREFDSAIRKIAATVKLNKVERGESDYIDLEKNYLVRGLEWVEPILKAITQKRVLRFEYQRFDKTESKSHLVEPYLIKEYKNFWYLVGNDVTKATPKVLTFALDRILEIDLTEASFERENLDKKSFYHHILGVTISDGKPCKVVLCFSPLQGKYVKALPIHHTQKVIRDNEKELRIELNLVINPELKMQILAYGASVRVVSPPSLVQDIQFEHERAAGLYRSS